MRKHRGAARKSQVVTAPKGGTTKLTRQELTEFKKLLHHLKVRIGEGLTHLEKENLLQSQRDASGDLSGYTFHMADVATDNFNREFSLNLASNEQYLLNEIDAALKRIDDRTYGICEACGKAIPKGRLKILPYARHCIPCQQQQEPPRR